MAAACAPSRASLLTGQYPSLHGVTQTDGLAKSADGDEMFWLAPDTVPTIGDWFRAGGYRTFYKGKWHVSHCAPGSRRRGYLQSIDDEGNPNAENIAAYLKADLLDDYGFSEWVGPEAHGLGKQNTGTAQGSLHGGRDHRAAEAARQGRQRAAVADGVLVPEPARHLMFGVIALAQGLRYDPVECRTFPMRRPTTRTCPPSRRASRATSMRGGRYSRRSRGSRRIGGSITRCNAR